MTSVNEELFKELVKRYIEINETMAAMAKQVTVKRKEKNDIGTRIIEYMRTHEVTRCKVRTGTISVAKTKSVKPVKKEDWVEILVKRAHLTVEKATQIIDETWQTRESVEREVVKYARKGGKDAIVSAAVPISEPAASGAGDEDGSGDAADEGVV